MFEFGASHNEFAVIRVTRSQMSTAGRFEYHSRARTDTPQSESPMGTRSTGFPQDNLILVFIIVNSADLGP